MPAVKNATEKRKRRATAVFTAFAALRTYVGNAGGIKPAQEYLRNEHDRFSGDAIATTSRAGHVYHAMPSR